MPSGEPTHGWWCNARTYRTRCKYCGEPVFFFTCDCGSKVFFDKLGWPWPEHHCVEYLIALYGKELVERAMSVQIKLPGRLTAVDFLDRDYANVIRRQSRRESPQPEHRIVRCSPTEREVTHNIGVIREVVAEVDVFRKLNIPRDSPFGTQLLGPLAQGEFVQLTVHVGDLGREDVNSYTFLVSKALWAESTLAKDDVVSFALRARVIPGRSVVWLCDELSAPVPSRRSLQA